eukprot:scaffold46666_cov35-Phaeocystis_antarctica.AAC.1
MHARLSAHAGPCAKPPASPPFVCCCSALPCPGRAFYVFAPELITRQNAALCLRRQTQPVGCYSPRPLLYPVRGQSGISRRLSPLPSRFAACVAL